MTQRARTMLKWCGRLIVANVVLALVLMTLRANPEAFDKPIVWACFVLLPPQVWLLGRVRR